MSSRAITQSPLPDWALPAAVTVIGIVAAITIAAGLDSPLRAVFVLTFLFFGPGLALTGLLQMPDLAQRFALAAAASLAVDVIVAVTLLYLAIYTYELGFAIVAAITAAALIAGRLQAQEPPDEPTLFDRVDDDDDPDSDPDRARMLSRLASYTEPRSGHPDA
jgi:uncharacterized membrane protein